MELVFALVTLSFTSFIDASSASTMVELSGGRRSSNGACEKDKWFQCRLLLFSLATFLL